MTKICLLDVFERRLSIPSSQIFNTLQKKKKKISSEIPYKMSTTSQFKDTSGRNHEEVSLDQRILQKHHHNDDEPGFVIPASDEYWPGRFISFKGNDLSPNANVKRTLYQFCTKCEEFRSWLKGAQERLASSDHLGRFLHSPISAMRLAARDGCHLCSLLLPSILACPDIRDTFSDDKTSEVVAIVVHFPYLSYPVGPGFWVQSEHTPLDKTSVLQNIKKSPFAVEFGSKKFFFFHILFLIFIPWLLIFQKYRGLFGLVAAEPRFTMHRIHRSSRLVPQTAAKLFSKSS
jgi:hypothetical protein